MSFQVKEPILIVGVGGVGSKLAIEVKEDVNYDCFLISNDKNDLKPGNSSVHITTGSVINPSVQFIRGSTLEKEEEIKSKISGYQTVILMSNLAGKAGSAISPIISKICKELETGLFSIAIMPFKYEKERIFNSGVALKRIRKDSKCTIVLDNDSLLESNPNLNTNTCYSIGNSAIMQIVKSIKTSEISDTNILTTSKSTEDIEESLRDSLKMLYDTAPPNAVKSSIIYVTGGENIPIGVINSITSISNGITNQSHAKIDMTSDESKIVMLSSIQGMTKFDKYDPLGDIPQENTLDWETPDCSIDCKIELYQLE